MKKFLALFLAISASVAVSATLDVSLFSYRAEIVFSGYSGASELVDFPALVKVSTDTIGQLDVSTFAEGGSDIRFADADGQLLAHDIESWNAAGTSFVWVKVPSLSGQKTSVTMYWGAADLAALPAVAASDVWTGYLAVWHLAGLDDATGRENALTATSATASESGCVGSAYALGTSSASILKTASSPFPEPTTPRPFTASGLVIASSGGYRLFTTKYSISDDGFDFFCANPNEFWLRGYSSNKTLKAAKSHPVSEWHHVAFTLDGTSATMYAEGSPLSASGSVAASQSYDFPFCIGNLRQGGSGLSGRVDEVRIYDGIRSDDWLAAESATAVGNASFTTYGFARSAGAKLAVELNGAEIREDGTSVTLSFAVSDPAVVSVVSRVVGAAEAVTNELAVMESFGAGVGILCGLARGTDYEISLLAESAEETSAPSDVRLVSMPAVFPAKGQFGYAAEISFPGCAAGVDEVGFPVLVRLSPDTISGFRYSQCRADGSDLRFATTNSIVLPHEIDTWDPDGVSLVWVRLPRLAPGVKITAYWNAADGTTLPSYEPANVWSNYRAVWHFNDWTDATGNGFTLSPTSAEIGASAGSVGAGATVTKSGMMRTVTPFESLSTPGVFSVFGFFRPASLNSGRFFSNKTNIGDKGFDLLLVSGPVLYFRGDGMTMLQSSTVSIVAGSWSGIGFSFDEGNAAVYLDGLSTLAGTVPYTGELAADFAIGNLLGGAAPICGDCDEVRIYDGKASAARCRAAYDVIVDNAGFVSCGPAVSQGTDGPPVVNLSGLVSSADGTSMTVNGSMTYVPDCGATVFAEWSSSYDGVVRTNQLLNVSAPGVFVGVLSGVRPAFDVTLRLFARSETKVSEPTDWRRATANGTYAVESARFSKEVVLTICGLAEEDSVEGLPVPVRLSEASLPGFHYSRAGKDGAGICFADADGIMLAHEVERWDPSGESVVWVRLPLAETGTVFRLYWGGGARVPQLASALVWSDYAAVWHMEDGLTDSTDGGRDLSAAEATVDAGRIGRGQRLAGTSASRLTSDEFFSALTDARRVTVSGWFARATTGSFRYFANKTVNSDVGFEVLWPNGGTSTGLWLRGSGASPTVGVSSGVAQPLDAFCHVAAVMDGTTGALWYDGAEVVTGTIAEPISSTAKFAIGNLLGGSAPFGGVIDEVRVYDGVASAVRLRAEVASTRAEFLSFGPVRDKCGLTIIVR